ncbi:MAG TPA: amidohydrolase family protein [Dehalococcoidia bacterium]|nr:amidohydrolase family protein [Dehalococcoidia bacterium]
MKIDAFTHILTTPYIDKLRDLLNRPTFHGEHLIPELIDYEQRLRDMDAAGIDKQIVTMPSPPTDQMHEDPALCAELTAIINNAMYDLAGRFPDRFLPIATVALNNLPSALKEAERGVKELGMHGVLIYTNGGGRMLDDPELLPFFELVESLGKPMWIHPTNNPIFEGLKYGLGSKYGWPFNTTIAMSYLAFGGVFDRCPMLRVITHHAGAMVPFFENRGGGDGMTRPGVPLNKAPNDYYRMFFVDTAVQGSIGAMLCSYNFYGSEQMLFGTDYPYAKARVGHTIASVEALPVPPAQKEAVFSGNVERLLGL